MAVRRNTTKIVIPLDPNAGPTLCKMQCVATIFAYLPPVKNIQMQALNKRIYHIVSLTMHEVKGKHINPYKIRFTTRRNKFPFYANEELEWPNWLERKSMVQNTPNDLRLLQLNGVQRTESDAMNLMLNTGHKRYVYDQDREWVEKWTNPFDGHIRKIDMFYAKDRLQGLNYYDGRGNLILEIGITKVTYTYQKKQTVAIAENEKIIGFRALIVPGQPQHLYNVSFMVAKYDSP